MNPGRLWPLRGKALPARGPRWIRKFSFKTRLIAAFLILIITSASATVGIGNAVFGRKVVELATSTMGKGLRVVDMHLSGRLAKFGLLAVLESDHAADAATAARRSTAIFAAEPALDFVLLAGPGCWNLLLRAADDTTPLAAVDEAMSPAGSASQAAVQPGERGRSATTGGAGGDPELAAFLARASERERGHAGLLVLPAASLARFGYEDPPACGLLMAAAAPLRDGNVLLLGSLIEGRSEFLSAVVSLLWPESSGEHVISIFLGDRCVASSPDDGNDGSVVDPAVIERVLGAGEAYIGPAEIMGGSFYTAYMPLRDWRGENVGILGVGGREEAYSEMRRQTVTLFAGLIALGMIFGFIMTYTFSDLLIRPVADLAEGIHRVASGDLEHKVRIESADELGKLAKSFNRMVQAIRVRDIRLREMTEERLSQVEKQVSIGRLAGGVAHEINNPLTSILSLTMLALQDLDSQDPRREDLQIVVEETKRCREIVQALLDFARERPAGSQLVDINQVIRDTLLLTSKYEGMDDLRVLPQLSTDSLLVNGDPKQLQQVFTNIITNAAEALSAGGDMTITTDEDSSGGYVVIRVMDTGKGISQEDLGRVFEPFFTTKAGKKGTGLGLSVSLGIVRKHQGTIEIESEEGYGSTVSVFLPRATEGSAA